MLSFRSKNRKKLPAGYTLLILTACCLILVITSLTLNLSGGPLHTAAGYILVPMQRGINAAGEWLVSRTDYFRSLSGVLEENEQLQEQLDSLTDTVNDLIVDSYELKTYQELYDLDQTYAQYDKISANVVAKGSGSWFDTFTIDRGTSDGVASGMNVIAGSGLAGIVTKTGVNYAVVRTIVNDESNVSVMTLTTGDNFTLSGNLELVSESGLISYSGLQDDADAVQVGDPVVTSYVSDQYLQEIFVGYIASVEEGANHLTKNGTILPAVDFAHLQKVFVLTEQKDADEIESLGE